MEIFVSIIALVALAAAIYVFAIKPKANQSGTSGSGGGIEPRNTDTDLK